MLQVDISAQRGAFRLNAGFSCATPGVTALFGRSGSGKSTLVAALTGLLPGVTGRVQLGGEIWLDTQRGIRVPAERRRIGCVFQDSRLFPHLSVQGNLDYAQSRARDRPAFVGREALIDVLGIGALLTRRPATLSGGERSRVALARALLSQPSLLVLDEPFANLDLARREEVLPYLERLRDDMGLAIVYVSHQYDEVLRLAGQVVLLDAGCVAASGTPTALALDASLRAVVGSDMVGAIVEGPVLAHDPAGDPAHELVAVGVGAGELRLPCGALAGAARARVLVPARDVLLALAPVSGLSVRNQLQGVIVALHREAPGAWLVEIDVGGARLLARVTAGAARELSLEAGRAIHVLVKAESLRGHAYRDPSPVPPAGAT